MTPASSVLFVAGGEAVMRQTFAEHGRGYWSAEFGLVLEKHGWLDFETAEPAVLAERSRISAYDLLIVAWLPEDAWRTDYVESLRAFEGILLLEGPFPSVVEELLGLERSGAPLAGARGHFTFADDARSYVEARFGDPSPIGHRSGPDPSLMLAAGGVPRPIELVPRQTVTRRAWVGRSAFFEVESEPFAPNVGRAAISIVLAYRARFAQNQRFFDDPVDDALALLACVRCLAVVSTDPLAETLRRLVLDAAGSNRPPVPLTDVRSALARAIWAVALAEASVALEDTTFAERARDVVTDVRAEWHSRKRPDPFLTRWRTLLALELAELSTGPSGPDRTALFEAFLPAGSARPAVPDIWLDVQMAERLQPHVPATARAATSWLEEVAALLTASSGPSLPSPLEGRGLPDLMLVLGALRRANELPAARRLWRIAVDALHDSQQGLFRNATVVDGRLVPSATFATTPRLALGLVDAAGRISFSGAPARALEQYTAEQLEAWMAAPYTLQPYSGVDAADVVATLSTDRSDVPAIWRRGNVFATSFQLLAQLVHVHTVEPLADPFQTFRSGDTIALEYLLLQQLGGALAQRGPSCVQVAPWPWGIRYALTVRHDVDRVLDRQQFSRLFEFERGHELGVTWFWLPDRLEPHQMETLESDPRHEIGLHAVRIDQKQRELGIVDQACSTPIAGEAIHGSGDGWLGYTSVRAAIEAGLLYTELAPPVSDCPYARYPWIDAQGRVGFDRIIGVSYNISIEGKLGTKPGSEGGPKLYRQLLNHPDLNFDRLENWITSLPAGPRIDWTCGQVARWWQATHVAGGLSIRHVAADAVGAIQFEIAAPVSLEDLELRIPCPVGAVSAVSVDGHDADWGTLDEPEYSGIRVRCSPRAGVPVSVVVQSVVGRRGGEPVAAARPISSD